MSSAGQIVGGAVGAVAGFFLGGNVATGAQIGMMLGGLIDPPKGPTVTGPRLTDLTIQTSTYGAVIPRLYGTTSVHGNVFWLENNKIKETVVKKKSGGKGGPKTTTKTYVNTATFALGLCRGQIAGVRRISISGKLYYDAGSSDTDTIIASNQAASGFTVHTGTDTQLPDTRMQATLGAANTPAWRGLAYIVFNDLPLADYGDALAGAQVKVEIVQTATYGDDQHSYTPPSSRWLGIFQNNGFLWSVGGQSMASGNQVCYSSDGGQTWSSNTALDFTSYWIAAGSNNNLYLALAGYGDGRVARSTNLTSWTTVSGPDAWWRQMIVNGSTFLCFGANTYTTTDGVNFTSVASPSPAVIGSATRCGVSNGVVYAVPLETPGSLNAKIGISPVGSIAWTAVSVAGFNQIWGINVGPAGSLIAMGTVDALGGKYCITISYDNGATWSSYIEIPFYHSTILDVSWNGTQYMALELNYDYFYTSTDLVTWERHATIQGGLYYGPPVWDGAYWNHLRNNENEPSKFIKFRTGVMTGSTNPILGDIVRAECLLSNVLDSGDITTSGLTSEVRGYLVGSVGTLRNALVPLQAAWPFDVVQRGYKLEFLPRGGSSVATILSDDLDARPDTGKPGVQITMPREMDTQLPRVLTIKYQDYDREYDVGEQYAERLNTDSVNEEVQELPIVMLASEAAGKAEVLLYVRWMERTDVSVVVPGTYNHLEVGDTVTLQTPEGNVTIRITAANYTSDGRVEIKAKFANSAVYAPAALGVPSVVSGVSTIPSIGPSRYVLLDVPYMGTVQSTPGFLATMYGGSGWPGGVLVRTDDGGTTWTDVQAFDSAGGTVGSASNTIGVVDSRVWDKASVLSVTLNNGTLSSATEAAVLNGGNYFAYGVDGRWEIIAAKTCTLVSGSTYTIQDLLRGRFGTEWAMGMHAVGDTIVALNTSDVTAIGMSSSSIGLSRAYRGITYGQDISSDSDRDFTYRAVNLECLSPVFFNGDRTVSTGDWTISWVRRSRTDGEWRDLVDAGQSETSEAYEVDIYSDNTYTTIKRTLTAVSPSCIYTQAQQASDFGLSQPSIYCKVYQMSSVVGRGYPLTGVTFTSPVGYGFVQTQNVTYLETLPSALQLLNETFPADVNFTKYTESFAGTTAVASNKYTITHVGSKNDIVVKNTVSFSMPLVWVEVTVGVTNTGGTGYDNGGVGLVKDANNFIFASMDRLANTIRLQIKIGGTNTFIGSVAQTWGTSFKIALSLVANSACVWVDTGSGWTYKTGSSVVAYYDFRTTGNLTGWNPGFTLANGGGNSTWDFSALKAGAFGGVGMRDQTLVTDSAGLVYFPSTDTIQFSATLPDPRGEAYCGVFTMNLLTNALVQTSAIMVSRSGKTYNDLSAHIIRYDNGDRRMLISTWGNGFGGSIQTLHELFTSGDVLSGFNVVTMTAITLPGQVGTLPGAYDAMMAWDGSQWLIAYTLTRDTSFAGNPFYAALATSASMSSFSLVSSDTTNSGYEGSKLINDSGVMYVMASGPAGTGDKVRVYDIGMNYLGDLTVSLSGGADTQPHPMMFPHGGKRKILTFDNTRYGGVQFTWGHIRIYEAL